MNLEHEDWELQQAIALSVQEIDNNNTQNAERSHGEGKQHTVKPQQQPANDSTRRTSKQKKKAIKKLPSFDPTTEEAESIFSEIDSSHKRFITGRDLQDTATRLGLAVDDEQALAMIEYATEHGLKQSSHPSGLSLDDFLRIIHHFKVIK